MQMEKGRSNSTKNVILAAKGKTHNNLTNLIPPDNQMKRQQTRMSDKSLDMSKIMSLRPN